MEKTNKTIMAIAPINKSAGGEQQQHQNGSTVNADKQEKDAEGSSSQLKSLSPIRELKLHQRCGIPMPVTNGESSEEVVPHSTKSFKPPVDLMSSIRQQLISKKISTVKNGSSSSAVGSSMEIAVRGFHHGNESDDERSSPSTRQPSAGGSSALELAAQPGQPALVKIEARKVNCRSADGELFVVDWYLMQQSKQFKRSWEEHREAVKQKRKTGSNNGRSRKFTFNMESVGASTFRLVLEWLEQHDGMDDPVVREDPNTGERLWFELTAFERQFFDQPVHVLNELINAGKTLDIPSLYLFGCQSIARLLQEKSGAEIREMFGLKNDMTSTDKAQFRRRDRKFRMRELKAARYSTQLQQLQSHLQQLELKGGNKNGDDKKGYAMVERMLTGIVERKSDAN